MKIFRASFYFLVFLFGFTSSLFAQTPPRYDITVDLDVKHKKLDASQTVSFTNNSQGEINDLVFHIYPNRQYSAKEKSLMYRFAGYFKVDPFPSGFQTGTFAVKALMIDGQKADYVIEGKDKTLLRLLLPQPLKPGEQVAVQIEFSVDIPHVTLGRFGWHDGVFRLSRWYPILAVYENGRGWNDSPFYPFHRPFYSEASYYKVTLTIEEDQIVAHTGTWDQERFNQGRTKTEIYETPEPVREFTLATSRSYNIVVDSFENVEIFSYYLPGRKQQAQAAVQSAKDLMKLYAGLFGPYPYKSFTIVPVDLGYGGEQMSNLIFIDRRTYELPGIMNRYFDFLVAHETGHQWFYNVVGVNEYREMWLEEGINSYFIERYLAEKYGEDGEVIDYPEWFEKFEFLLPKLTFKKTRDTRYKMITRAGHDHAIISDLASFSEPSSIFSVTYGKGARVLGMLRHEIGDEAFEKLFKRLYAEYRFKNLKIEDFIRIAEEESGLELSGFFKPWLFSDQQLNYAVKRGGKKSIILENRGGINVPAKVEVTRQNGDVESFIWRGDPKRERIEFKGSSPIVKATVDPDDHLLDIDRVNNHWPRKVNVKFVPLYLPLYEIPVLMPEDGYNVVAGPAAVDSGFGVKASLQKPYDQIAYTWSSYEFGEKLHHSGAGYQLKNILHQQMIVGVEIANTKDYDNGDDDLASGKIFIRKELWPVQYSVPEINDHISLYLLRNQSIHDRASLTAGKEAIRQVDYSRSEAIVGTALHLNRSGTSPDPSRGYQFDLFAENSGHFLGATQTFSRAGIESEVYIPTTLKSKLAVRGKYGFGYPRDKELFYAGGMEGLRGYQLKDIRGANLLLGSLEYRFPLFQNLDISLFDHVLGLEEIGWVVFGDIGQAWFNDIDHSHLYKDAGMGLRLTFNIGKVFEKVVVRIDAAQAINDEHEDEPRFWLGLGHAF